MLLDDAKDVEIVALLMARHLLTCLVDEMLE